MVAHYQSSGHSDDPNKKIVVLPAPLPSEYRTDVDKSGQPIKVLVPVVEPVDPTLINASAILGASRVRTFFRIILPLSIGGVITGIVLSFAHTLGEFGVVLMVGGNIPGISQTISIAIYDNVQALDYTTANHMALLLLLFSFGVLSILYALNRRIWAVWPLHR